MNHEKINAEAKKYYRITHRDENGLLYAENYDNFQFFLNGVYYAAANPDVIDCIKTEDALGFAEWVKRNSWLTKESTELLLSAYLKQKQ